MPKLTIIIVNYNTYEYTYNTIKSVLESKIGFDYEIVLVDNASVDKSIDKLENDFAREIKSGKITVIKNKENKGFSGANNQAMKLSKADYILLLNSDTKVFGTTIENCLNYLAENTKPCMLTCKILLENGELDHACKRGFPTPEASFYYFTGLDKKNPDKYGTYDCLMLNENSTGYVDVISGAFMLIPKEIVRDVGYFDESFFMYGEDIDYCYRAKEKGYKIIYYPVEKIIHYKKKSRGKRRFKTIYNFYSSMWIFYKKHYIRRYNVLVSLAVFCGIFLKFAIDVLKNLFLRGK